MKKIKYIFSCCLSAALMAGVTSCKLDEYNPSGATAEQVWNTPEGFITAVNAAYDEQREWYGKENGIFMSEAGSDLWFNKEKDGYARQMTKYSGLSAADGNPHKAAWKLLWKSINLCNAGINRINDAGFVKEEEKNRREGELRFLRAFYYWHVVETYGGVMLLTEETKGPNLTATRSSVDEFYKLIISDLEFAAANLPVQSAWGNEYSRASKKSALGFLARAYLSRAYYNPSDAPTYFAKARDVANDIISRKGELEIDLWENYADLFKPANNKKNKEALYVVSNSTNFSLNYDDNGNRLFHVFQAPYNGKPGLTQSLEYGFENNRRLMPTRALLDFFEDEMDARYAASFQEVWIANKDFTWTEKDATTYLKDPSVVGKKIRAGVDTAMYITKKSLDNDRIRPYATADRDSVYLADGKIRTGRDFISFKKFLEPNRTAPNSQAGYNDVIVMRLAEIYLIAAEAEFQLGNSGEAVKHINVLRTRAAKKTPVDYTADMQVDAGDITLDFILDERARELAGENIRWFDLKRTGKLVERVKKYNPDITEIQDFHILRPISIVEMQALLNAAEFKQNPGYN